MTEHSDVYFTYENGEKLVDILKKYPFEFTPDNLILFYFGINDSESSDVVPKIQEMLDRDYPSKQVMVQSFFMHRLRFPNRTEITRRPVGKYNLWDDLKSFLDTYPGIVSWGNRRGIRYRHKSTRPRFLTSLVTEACREVLDEKKEKMSWRDVYNSVYPILEKIHNELESGGIRSKYNGSGLKYELSQNHLHQQLKGPFSNNIEEWVKTAYTEDWFYKNWSVIQRNLKDSVMHVEGERGMWISKSATVTSDRSDDPDRSSDGRKRAMELSKSENKLWEVLHSTIKQYRENNLDPKLLLPKINILFEN